MKVKTAQGVIWVCISCYLWKETHEPSAPWASCGCTPWSREPDTDVTPGVGTDECGCDLDSEEGYELHAEGCETHTFSRYPCDACGCDLAGSRHAYTWWGEDS